MKICKQIVKVEEYKGEKKDNFMDQFSQQKYDDNAKITAKGEAKSRGKLIVSELMGQFYDFG